MEFLFHHIIILTILGAVILIIQTPLGENLRPAKEASTFKTAVDHRTNLKNAIQHQSSESVTGVYSIKPPSTAQSTIWTYQTTTALTTTTTEKQVEKDLKCYSEHLAQNITQEEDIIALEQESVDKITNDVEPFSLGKAFISDCFCFYIFHGGKLSSFFDAKRFREEMLTCKEAYKQAEGKYVLQLIQSVIYALIVIVPCSILYSYDFRLYAYVISSGM